MGYGDGDESTVISFGSDALNKHITAYFRGAMFVEDASRVVGLNLRLIRDDGAVVYLNGQEIYRSTYEQVLEFMRDQIEAGGAQNVEERT